ncbi:hypothetical protein ACFOWE_08480 [Planomonospora corallina]|uniref:DUF4386 family protein n=1 Tax=Planomonospora corallina TaxID=1806052 RepID=A0ABV8I2B6_9ACTN
MTSTTDRYPGTRLTGALLLSSPLLLIAAAVIVIPAGLTLNPADPAGALAAVGGRAGLHLTELALDVLGWLALTAAGLLLTTLSAPGRGPGAATGGGAGAAPLPGSEHGPHPAARPGVLPGGLLAAAGLAGLLHDAGNLALTQLAADPAAPASVTTAWAVLLTAKWAVNLAGLLWVSATAATAALVPMPGRLRLAGAAAALSGLVSVVLPWTTGTAAPSPVLEQAGYALHLPVMLWYGVLGLRCLRGR